MGLSPVHRVACRGHRSTISSPWLALLGALLAVLANLAVFDGLIESRPQPEGPLVSILVPARNEELNIGACLRSLVAQDHPYCEVLLLDDSSTDATAEIARGLGFTETGTVSRLIRGELLPEGWTGKCWACHQLAQKARGEFILSPMMIPSTHRARSRRVLAYAGRRRADLVSVARLVTISWGEQLILPMITLLAMNLYPHWLLLLLQRFPAAARRLRGNGFGSSERRMGSRSSFAAPPMISSAAMRRCTATSSEAWPSVGP